MRDEKEERKKQARSNKHVGYASALGSHFIPYDLLSSICICTCSSSIVVYLLCVRSCRCEISSVAVSVRREVYVYMFLNER